MQKDENGSSVNIFSALASSSPQFGVAVRAAEAGAVVDVLIGHQPLQRINRLQTRHTGLPHRQAEALHAHTHTQNKLIKSHVTYIYVYSLCDGASVKTHFGSLELRRGGRGSAGSRACRIRR